MPNSDTPVSVDHPHNLEAYLHTMEHDLRLRIDSGALRDPLMIGGSVPGIFNGISAGYASWISCYSC